MRRLDFLLTGFLAVLLTSCGQRVQNTDSKPAVKIDTVLYKEILPAGNLRIHDMVCCFP